jgi:hypothetical protein
MSHMSHRHIAAGQQPRKVGHCHVPVMSHMSHRRKPAMSLMSLMGHSDVPLSAQLNDPMGHVGHDRGHLPPGHHPALGSRYQAGGGCLCPGLPGPR